MRKIQLISLLFVLLVMPFALASHDGNIEVRYFDTYDEVVENRVNFQERDFVYQDRPNRWDNRPYHPLYSQYRYNYRWQQAIPTSAHRYSGGVLEHYHGYGDRHDLYEAQNYRAKQNQRRSRHDCW
jgi:hypothetical protein